jgi:hypothetical protein
MAYKTKLITTCYWGACQRPAKWAVFNRFHSEMGRFCTRHANEHVAELDTVERERRSRAALTLEAR